MSDVKERVKDGYSHPDFDDMTAADLKAAGAKFNIDTWLLRLLWDEPFYGTVVRHMTKVTTEQIPTMGVCVTPDDIKLIYNPMFAGAYVEHGEGQRVLGTLTHECRHLVDLHCTARRFQPHIAWNWATDMAINGDINADRLPKCGLRPGSELWVSKKMLAKMKQDPDRYALFKRISSKVKGFTVGLAAEEYFSLMANDQDFLDWFFPKGQGGQGGQGEGEGAGSMDDHGGWGAKGDKEGSPGGQGGQGGQGGDELGECSDGEMSDSDREYVEGKVRNIVRNAVEECDKKGSWGSVGAEMRERLRRFVYGEVDWRAVLRGWTGTLQRADRRSSVHRIHKKFPGVYPGVTRAHRPAIGVFLDQSGSVSDHALELFFGELCGLSHLMDFYVYNFDTDVDVKSERKWTKGGQVGLERTRCGGTNFDAVTRFMGSRDCKHKLEGVIILTDGGAPKPQPARGHKRCWVLEPNTDLYFKDQKDAADQVVHMKGAKGKAA